MLSKTINSKQFWPELWLAILPVTLVVCYTDLLMDPVTLPRLIVLSIWTLLSLVFLLFSGEKNEYHIPKTALAPWILLVLAGALSLFNAVSKPEALMEISRLLMFFLMFLVMWFWWQRFPNSIKGLLKGMLVSVAIILVWGIQELLNTLPNLTLELQELYQVKATMAHKNLLSSFYLLCLPIVGIGYLQLGKTWKLLAILEALLLLFMVVVLQNRSSWVTLALLNVVAIILSVYYLLRKPSKASIIAWLKYSGVYLTVFSIIVLGSYFLIQNANPQSSEFMVRKAKSTVVHDMPRDHNMETIQERFYLWNNTVQLIKEYPVWGCGAGNWKLQHPKFGLKDLRAEDGYIIFQRPHNDYLWVIAEMGIIGILGWILLMLFPTLLLLRFIINTKQPKHFELILSGIGIILFSSIAFFSFPKERTVHFFLLATYILLVYHWAVPMLPGVKVIRVSYKRLRVKIGVMIVLCMAIGAVFFYRTYSAYHATKMIQQYHVKNWQQCLQHANKAYSAIYQMDVTATPVLWYRGIAHFNMGHQKAALADFQKAVAYCPNHLHLLNNLASSWVLAGDVDQGISFYERALDISPHYEESLLNLAAVYNNKGAYTEALLLIKRVDVKSKHPSYLTYLNAVLKGYTNEVLSETRYPAFDRNKVIQEHELLLLALYNQSVQTGDNLDSLLLTNLSTILEEGQYD